MIMLKILFEVFRELPNGFALLITVRNLFSIVSISPNENRRHLYGEIFVIFPSNSIAIDSKCSLAKCTCISVYFKEIQQT